jgi:hypothetical protein
MTFKQVARRRKHDCLDHVLSSRCSCSPTPELHIPFATYSRYSSIDSTDALGRQTVELVVAGWGGFSRICDCAQKRPSRSVQLTPECGFERAGARRSADSVRSGHHARDTSAAIKLDRPEAK